MTVYRTSLTTIPAQLRGCALTIGNFDGVHLGHQVIVRTLLEKARGCGGPAAVVTFDPSPARLLRPESRTELLTTLEERGGILQRLGVDAVVVIETTPDLLALGPREFFDEILIDRFGVRAIAEGRNFRFGRGRGGSVETLEEYCREAGVDLAVVPDQYLDGQVISSSSIRRLLSAGDVGEASQMLGRPYAVAGEVVRGAARGRQIGFPTANLGPPATMLPAHGVYACRVEIDGTSYAAASHVGPNTTFGESDARLECHVIDFAGDLYGRTLRVEFLRRLRGAQKYDGVEPLVRQMHIDVEAARQVYLSF